MSKKQLEPMVSLVGARRALVVPVLAVAVVAAISIWLMNLPITRSTDLVISQVNKPQQVVHELRGRLQRTNVSEGVASRLQADASFTEAVRRMILADDKTKDAADLSQKPVAEMRAHEIGGEIADLIVSDATIDQIAACLSRNLYTPCAAVPIGTKDMSPAVLQRQAALFGIDTIARKDLNATRENRLDVNPEVLRSAAFNAVFDILSTTSPEKTARPISTLEYLDQETARTLQRRLAGRLTWVGGVLLFAVVAILAIGCATVVTSLQYGQTMPPRIMGTFVTIGILGAAAIAVRTDLVGPQIIQDLIRDALTYVPDNNVLSIASGLNGLAFVASLALVVAMGSTVMTDISGIEKAKDRRDLLFTIAAGLLVSGVTVIGALHRLPSTIVLDIEATKELESLALSATTAAALVFCLALAVAHLATYGASRLVNGGTTGPSTVLNSLPPLLKILAPAWLGLSIDQLLSLFTSAVQ